MAIALAEAEESWQTAMDLYASLPDDHPEKASGLQGRQAPVAGLGDARLCPRGPVHQRDEPLGNGGGDRHIGACSGNIALQTGTIVIGHC